MSKRNSLVKAMVCRVQLGLDFWFKVKIERVDIEHGYAQLRIGGVPVYEHRTYVVELFQEYKSLLEKIEGLSIEILQQIDQIEEEERVYNSKYLRFMQEQLEADRSNRQLYEGYLEATKFQIASYYDDTLVYVRLKRIWQGENSYQYLVFMGTKSTDAKLTLETPPMPRQARELRSCGLLLGSKVELNSYRAQYIPCKEYAVIKRF